MAARDLHQLETSVMWWAEFPAPPLPGSNLGQYSSYRSQCAVFCYCCYLGHWSWHLPDLGRPETERCRIGSGRCSARSRRRSERCGRHDPAGEHDRSEERIRQFTQRHPGSAATPTGNDQLVDLPATSNGPDILDTQEENRNAIDCPLKKRYKNWTSRFFNWINYGLSEV